MGAGFFARGQSFGPPRCAAARNPGFLLRVGRAARRASIASRRRPRAPDSLRTDQFFRSRSLNCSAPTFIGTEMKRTGPAAVPGSAPSTSWKDLAGKLARQIEQLHTMSATVHNSGMESSRPPACPNCFRPMASSKGIRDHEGGREERANAFRCYYCNIYSAEPTEPASSQGVQ